MDEGVQAPYALVSPCNACLQNPCGCQAILPTRAIADVADDQSRLVCEASTVTQEPVLVAELHQSADEQHELQLGVSGVREERRSKGGTTCDAAK